MKQILFSRSSLALILAFGFVFGLMIFADKNEMTTVKADMTAQTLPFAQNWANTDLITTNDDWSGVMGITGFRGDALTPSTGTDPQTIVADGSGTPIDVIANEDNPSTLNSGGIAEFDTPLPPTLTGGFNPSVALQGSGTADAPHIVIYLNTNGQSNIRVQYNAKDIDNQTNNDADQQINTQFRVGGTGDYTNITGGYIADATTDGTNDVTPVDVTLPASADNQALVEVRIMTTNAPGSDEWIAIDDISITAGAAPTPADSRADFDGDGKTDISVYRGTEGNWYLNQSLDGFGSIRFGTDTDRIIPGDYDGDGKADTAIFRPSDTPGVTDFWILNSGSSTLSGAEWGLTNDFPVVGDVDGDGKDDIIIWRPGTSTFYAIHSVDGSNTIEQFGLPGDFPLVIDNDGDGKDNLAVYRPGENTWYIARPTGTPSTNFDAFPFGTAGDQLVPADYNGDGRTDIAMFRQSDGNWFVLDSATLMTSVTPFGTNGDIPVPGDYDGDGNDDMAIYRDGIWWINGSISGVSVILFGINTDLPIPSAYLP